MNRAEKRRQKKQRGNRASSSTAAADFGRGPGSLEAVLLKAVQHHNSGELREAEALYRRVLAADPDQPDALNLLGVIARQSGDFAAAVDLISRSVAVRPGFADAHNNLGNAFLEQRRLDEAMASYRKALDLNPRHADALNNLGSALNDLGRAEEAFACHRRAIEINPDNDSYWTGLAKAVQSLPFSNAGADERAVLFKLLARRTVRPADVARPVVRALQRHPEFADVLDRTSGGAIAPGATFADLADKLSAIPLFLRIVSLCPVTDLTVERMLTALRRAMIEDAIADALSDSALPFLSALAIHCFTNEYVFDESEDERMAVRTLEHRVAAAVGEPEDIPATLIAAIAAYRPLHTFSWAEKLLERTWPESCAALIGKQIREPIEERSLHNGIEILSPIRDAVSQAVRDQYEANPYPRWTSIGLIENARPVRAVLQGAPLHFDMGDYVSPERPEILIAGCGTGQIALLNAARFSQARLLAMDLSMSSLCYAARKSRELGFSNVAFAQGDILELGDMNRTFDLIDCSGVLHHLGDPMAGWRILTDILRPGGVMKIGLYSERARQPVAAARSLIAEKGYAANEDDIRRCRRDIVALAEAGDPVMSEICGMADFYSTSDCRDLLFHVQEHRFTLPMIGDAVKSLGLTFLGFEMRNQSALRRFNERHPEPDAATSFALWDDFEQENPDTFLGMYQFWCRKP